MSDNVIAIKRKPGRPKLPIDRRMQFLSIQVPPEMREKLDTYAIRCDTSISQLGRVALCLLFSVIEKGERDGKYV